MSNFLSWLAGWWPWPRPHPGPVPPPAPSGPVPSLSEVYAGLTAARAEYRLPPLRIDPRLESIAQQWAGALAATGRLDHGDAARRIVDAVPGSRAEGEDIALGYPSASAVVAGWMESPGHRANILGDFDLVGAGVARSAAGVLYWVVDFDEA